MAANAGRAVASWFTKNRPFLTVSYRDGRAVFTFGDAQPSFPVTDDAAGAKEADQAVQAWAATALSSTKASSYPARKALAAWRADGAAKAKNKWLKGS